MGSEGIDDRKDEEVGGKPQNKELSEADKRRRKLEEDMQKEQAERNKKREELLRKEKDYEKVWGGH